MRKRIVKNRIVRICIVPLLIISSVFSTTISGAASASDGGLSFTTSYGYGAICDGIDFEAFLGEMLFMGTYEHVSDMTALFTRETSSSWTQPVVSYEDTAQPILWRVMGEEEGDGTLTLLSEYVIDSRQFHNSDVWLNFDYPESSIRAWLNGNFLNNSFSASESGALSSVDVVQKMWDPRTSTWVYGSFTTLWGSAPEHTTDFPKTAYGDKVYLPWREYDSNRFHWDAANKSVEEYLISGDTAVIQLRNGKTQTDNDNSIWALSRSPMPESSNHILPGNYSVSRFGIRPIIKLNPSNVIYARRDGNYMLTLLNESIKLTRVSATTSATVGNADPSGRKISLTAVASGHNELAYKIVLMTGANREIVAYGTGGISEITVDTSTLATGEYAIYIWAQKDGAVTKEGSRPMYTTLNVSDTGVSINAPMSVANFDKTQEPEMPIISVENSLSNFSVTKKYSDDTFTDIRGLWGESFIKDAYTYGIIDGVGNSNFDPHGTLTGAQAITIAARIHATYKYGSEQGGSIISEYSVPNGGTAGAGWWGEYVAYAKAEGLIDSQLDSKLNNASFLTRAEMVYMWSNILQDNDMTPQNTVHGLPDVDSSTPYYTDIIKFYEAGITGGRDAKGTFAPNDSITRMECATIFMRLVQSSNRISGVTYGTQQDMGALLASPEQTQSGSPERAQPSAASTLQASELSRSVIAIISASAFVIVGGGVVLFLRHRKRLKNELLS